MIHDLDENNYGTFLFLATDALLLDRNEEELMKIFLYYKGSGILLVQCLDCMTLKVCMSWDAIFE